MNNITEQLIDKIVRESATKCCLFFWFFYILTSNISEINVTFYPFRFDKIEYLSSIEEIDMPRPLKISSLVLQLELLLKLII